MDGVEHRIAQIRSALSSLDGVEHADARTRQCDGLLEIVGVLTVSEDSPLTPIGVMHFLKKTFPKSCWPDQIFMAFQGGQNVATQRAA